MLYFIKNLRHIQKKKLHKVQEFGMCHRLYRYYGQWTAVDIHKNHWLKNQIDQVIIVFNFKDIQAKN